MRTNYRSSPFFLILNFAFLILELSATAQIQQAWTAKYNNGLTNGSHQSLKVALDLAGNVLTCGFSQNTDGGTGYVTLKYAPAGNQLWVARLDPTNDLQASPNSFAIDLSNNIVVTGNTGTVKYDPSGAPRWTNSIAGLAVAVDGQANILLTGFGTNFNTAKLNPGGTNLWLKIDADVGPTIGQSVVVDSAGDAYVSGSDVYYQGRYADYTSTLLVVKYGTNGSLLWYYQYSSVGADKFQQVSGASVDASGNLFVLFDENNFDEYMTLKLSANGEQIWLLFNPTENGLSASRGLAVVSNGTVAVTGQYVDDAYGTYGIDIDGDCIWTNFYPSQNPSTVSAAQAIASDQVGNFCVTGYSQDANGTNDIVTIAYDTNGKQLWLQRYTGIENYGAVGNAIAVDKSGNVYVAGYENVPGGGTEMVLIKYSPVTLQQQSNGNFLLQAQGAAGEPFDIQASTNLQLWSDLGLQDANTNGLLQYLDTNTALYPYRFYLAIPEP